MRFLTLFTLLLLALNANSQNQTIFNVPAVLLKDANSVVRLNEYDIDIPKVSEITIKHKKIITVLNKKGNKNIGARIYYDETSKIKDIRATIYNQLGKEIKTFKKRDFVDVSATDGFSLHTDTRILYLDYTPTSYPYTIVVESEKKSSTTAFIPTLYSNSGYYSSTEKIKYVVNYDPALGFKYLQKGPKKEFRIKESEGNIMVQANNIKPIIPEEFSSGFQNNVESISFALDNFYLEEVEGVAGNWMDFGKWMDKTLLADTQQLPASTIQKIETLVEGIEDPMERARKVYEFVQNKVRYVSIQIGIGGWKPMNASKVDAVGYGDCKALSMYTKSLLKVANVPSYYTIVYGDKRKRNIQSDFSGVQGNHVILTLPKEDNSYVWLECTSQEVPFGYIAEFTDDRDVVMITPEGGEIIHTKKYTAEDNFQNVSGNYILSANGNIKAKVNISSGGTQYGDKLFLVDADIHTQKRYYHDFWDFINNIKIQKIDLNNNRRDVMFNEEISFTASNYSSFAGEEMIVTANLFNRFSSIPSRLKNRTTDIEVNRGFTDVDSSTITIPEEYSIKVLPKDISIVNEFGEYDVKFEITAENKVIYKRKFKLKEGAYSPEKYKVFRKFFKKIASSDNTKILLVKK